MPHLCLQITARHFEISFPDCGIFRSFAGPTYFLVSFAAQERQLPLPSSQCACNRCSMGGKS